MSRSVFAYHSSKSEIPNPQHDINDKKTLEVYSDPIVNGASFKTGKTITFDFSTSGNQWIDLSDSYINIKLTVTDNAGAKLNAGANLALAFNAGGNLFSKASMQINNITVSSCNNVAQVEAYYWRSQTSKEFRQTLGSLSWLDDQASRKARTIKAKAHDVEYVPVCLAPFGSGDHQLIPPNNKIRISFDVAQDWEYRVVASDTYAARAHGAGGNYIVTVDDLVLNVVQYEGAAPPTNTEVYFDYKNMVSTFQNLTAAPSQSLKFPIAPNTYRLTMFSQSNTKTTTEDNIYEFRGKKGTNGEKTLQRFRLNIGSKQYPAPEANLSMQGDTLTVMKYYRDSLNSLMAFENPCGHESFTEWLDTNGPYFSFSLARDVTEKASYLDAYVTFSADPSLLAMWIVEETTSILCMKYDDMGRVINTAMTESASLTA